MWEIYCRANSLLRRISIKALDAYYAAEAGETFAAGTLHDYLEEDFARLDAVWPKDVSREVLAGIREELSSGSPSFTYVAQLCGRAGDILDRAYATDDSGFSRSAFIDLLHPLVASAALRHFQDGHHRDAVLNAIIAVFDFIRKRTGLDLDGHELVGRVFSLEKPLLKVGNLSTATGVNGQKGFLQLLQGAYTGIRNPRAHSLLVELGEVEAAQHLIFASLLARTVGAAEALNPVPQNTAAQPDSYAAG
jgi:uncharacterized protein (TIGR02391 family)